MKRLFPLFFISVLLFQCEEDSTNIVKDASGNVYEIVTLGTQTWITSNLNTTKYCDGAEITTSFDYFGVDSLNTKYGRLYPWSVAGGGKNPCPCGYHVPSLQELNTLISFLGTDYGAKMKAQKEWEWVGEYATDLSGLKMMPSSWYGSDMTDMSTYINNLKGKNYGYYWLNESLSDLFANGFMLSYNGKTSTLAEMEKASYRAIRCVKD